MTKPVHPTREAWLIAAVELLKPLFAEIEKIVPPIRVSTGWSKGSKKGSVGWCWKASVADDSSSNIFISPELVEPVIILAVLAHEMIHAVDDCKDAHAGNFRKMHAQIGLIGRPTASIPGLALTARLAALADLLGPYPHAKLTPGLQVKTQTTRMLKLRASCCGYVVRTSQKWVDEGLPSCPCGTEMELEQAS